MYDSDKTGMKHALEKLQAGQKVFLWGKLKQQLGPPRDKWDVNDVVLWCRQQYGNDYRLNWYDYFSDNPLDMLWLDALSGRL